MSSIENIIQFIDEYKDVISATAIIIGILFGISKFEFERKSKRNAIKEILKKHEATRDFFDKINNKISNLLKKYIIMSLLLVVLFNIIIFLYLYFSVKNTSIKELLYILLIVIFTTIVVLFSFFIAFLIIYMSYKLHFKIKSYRLMEFILTTLNLFILITLFLSAIFIILFYWLSYKGRNIDIIYYYSVTIILLIKLYSYPFLMELMLEEEAKKLIKEKSPKFPKVEIILKNGEKIYGQLENFLNLDYILLKCENSHKYIFWEEIVSISIENYVKNHETA